MLTAMQTGSHERTDGRRSSMIEDDLLTARRADAAACLAWLHRRCSWSASWSAACWVVAAAVRPADVRPRLPLLGLLPLVPFAYHMLFLAEPVSATPGQAMLGLAVRRNEDLGPPSLPQAVVSTLIFYLTLATSGLLLLVALFTRAQAHAARPVVSGLVVVRVGAPGTDWR